MVTYPNWNHDGITLPVFETVGRVVFNPDRGKMKKRTAHWVVIDLDRGLTAYYRWWLRTYWWEVDRGGHRRPVYMPSWDAHMSVVRGEQSYRLTMGERTERWAEAHRRFDGQKVRVYYTNRIRQTGDTTGGDRPDHFWFIDSHSDCVEAIRMILDLPTADAKTGRRYTSHITIGRTSES